MTEAKEMERLSVGQSADGSIVSEQGDNVSKVDSSLPDSEVCQAELSNYL